MVDSLSRLNPKIIFVTDPMCSWCWGMADSIKEIHEKYKDKIEFDLMLGGTNTDSTNFVGAYGKKFHFRLWQEINETTGKEFGFKLPKSYVHNSLLPCLAIELLKLEDLNKAFDLLYELQSLFFLKGLNINDMSLLLEAISNYGVMKEQGALELRKSNLEERVRFQFENSRSFGTTVLPNILFDDGKRYRLLLGGYADCEVIEKTLMQLNERGNYWPKAIHVD